MGGTTSKSDALYKKIHRRSRQTPVVAIGSVQNENTVPEVQRHRASRKAQRKERVSLSSNKDEDEVSLQGIASDGEASSVAEYTSEGLGITLSSGRSKTLGFYIESPEPDENPPNDSLTKKVASLDLTDPEQNNSQKKKSATKTRSCKDCEEREAKRQDLQYPIDRESPDLERDCESKAGLAGSRLDFQHLSSSSDEEEAPTLPRVKDGKYNPLMGNWVGSKGNLKKKGIKMLNKKKNKADKYPVVKAPDGPHANINWYMTEELDEDWLKEKEKEATHNEINGSAAVKHDEDGITSLGENLSGNEKLELDNSLRDENINIETAKRRMMHIPPIGSKKTLVSKSHFDTKVAGNSENMTEVAIFTTTTHTPIERFDGTTETKPNFHKSKKRDKTKKSSIPTQGPPPGMCNMSDSSDLEDNTGNGKNKKNKWFKKVGGINNNWMNGNSNRCESPGTALRNMKENGIIPSVRSMEKVREDGKHRELRDLEEKGIVSRERLDAQYDGSNPSLHRYLPAKLAPID